MTPASPHHAAHGAGALAPYDRALTDYLAGRETGPLVLSSGAEEDVVVPIRWFFRDHASFSAIDRKALALCRGPVLDLGAGAGPHSLALQHAGIEVIAVDISPQVCRILERRGVRKVICADCFELPRQRASTLLMLMNGIGLVGDLAGLDRFLGRAHNLLAPDGQILADSVERHTTGADHRDPVVEEQLLEIRYGIGRGAPRPWLMLGAEALARRARARGWSCRVVLRTTDGAYLARLTRDARRPTRG